MKLIEPYKTSLNANTAYWMARFSDLVYQPKDDGSPDDAVIYDNLRDEDPNFQAVYGFSHKSAQAIVVEHDNYLCFAFRGTDELEDWLDNLKLFSQKALFGEFHRGFWLSVNDLWPMLFSRYQDLRQKKKRPLFLTGHSLGGAMAMVAAARLIHEDLPFTSVYTFGQPRVMTSATARIFNVEAKSRVFRFQNNNDLVTRAPARLMGYSHAGTYVHIDEHGTLHLEPGFWFRFLDRVEGAVDDLFKRGLDGISDHAIKEYQWAVDKWDLKS